MSIEQASFVQFSTSHFDSENASIEGSPADEGLLMFSQLNPSLPLEQPFEASMQSMAMFSKEASKAFAEIEASHSPVCRVQSEDLACLLSFHFSSPVSNPISIGVYSIISHMSCPEC